MPKEFLRSGLLPRDVAEAERLDIVGSSGGLGAPRRGVWYMIDLGKDAPLCQAELGMRGRK